MANLAITLGDVLVNAKGGKFCPLKDAEGRPPTWTSDWLRIIWHPSAYGEPEARRVNLCVEPDDAAQNHFEAVERKLAQELSSKSIHDPKIFGKLIVASEVEARLQSCLKTGQRGSRFLKLKLNWDRAHFWGRGGPAHRGPRGPVRPRVPPVRGAAPSLADEPPVRPAAGGPRRAAAGARAERGGLPV